MMPLEYKTFCESTYSCPPGTDREEYLRLLLIEELGEVASLFAKAMRDGKREYLYKTICPMCGGEEPDDRSVRSCPECNGRGCQSRQVYGPDTVNRDALLKELGDVMWCAAMLSEASDTWDVARYFSRYTTTSTLLRAVAGEPIWHTLPTAMRLCRFVGFDPLEVAMANVEKLKGRVQRGTIHGAGDNR